MWSSWADNAKSSMTQALEKTGDALSKAATNAGKSARKPGGQSSSTNKDSTEQQQPQEQQPQGGGGAAAAAAAPAAAPPQSFDQPTIAAIPTKQQEILSNLTQGWSSMLETTKQSIQQAEQKVEASWKQAEEKVKTHLSKARTAYYKRDPSLPLDVEALKDAEVVYITDRIITLGHPAMASQVNGDISGERKLAAVGHLLDRRHDGRYMVWNLSEVDYDQTILNEQVLTFSFPGSPSPPLGLLLKLLVSMESWLKADDRNVAVVHCLTGKGRTSTVLAAFLCWMGQAGFSDIYQALEYIAACKQITADELTIPSQRRYASYFKNMLDGVRPSQPPLMLRRIIMSEAPRYARGPPRDKGSEDGSDSNNKKSSSKEEAETQLLGCVPYLQIFKAGKLLHTTPATLNFQQAENELPFCQVADGNISFHVNLVVQGDILVRARHLTASKKRVSMFRAAFHTGYAPPNVMRLTKSQLDGACSDDRFVDDFFLDFIFEPVDAEEASRLLKEEEEQLESTTSKRAKEPGSKAIAVKASADDSMLHRDSRFWDVIATRMKEHAADNSEREEDNMWGPTVGRRRDFSSNNDEGEEGEGKVTSEQERNALETFSIGGELDFLPETVEPESQAHPPLPSQTKPAIAHKKDSLMEALMGALDDDNNDDDDDDDEVVVFDDSPAPMDQDSTSAVETASAVTDEGATSEAGGSHKEPGMADSGSAAAPLEQQSEADEMANLMAEANMNLEDDMDALLAGAGGEGLSDDDLLNLDVDDAELDDLESFLSPTNQP